MRLNKYIRNKFGVSRRSADVLIAEGKVLVNSLVPAIGAQVDEADTVSVDGLKKLPSEALQTIILNKPVGYTCSKDGQGSKTIYELLPKHLFGLNPAGRLDKNSCGLVIMTSDGQLLYELTHPSNLVKKIYEVTLNKGLSSSDRQKLNEGVDIGDKRPSCLEIAGQGSQLTVTLYEGRKRQIRRSFSALGYEVLSLKRVTHGDYKLGDLKEGQCLVIPR